MAQIQNFNLGQLLGQAEAIKGARRQNQLGELLQPLKMQEAQLGLQQARLEQTQRVAKGAEAMMGQNWQDPEVWNRAMTMAEQQGADVAPLKAAGPTVEGYRLVQAYASGNQQAMDAATRNFQFLTEGLTETERDRARRIQLGLDPRAVGSSSQTIADTGKTDVVAGSEAVIAGAKSGASEGAKLTEQREQLPQLRSAIVAAETAAKQAGEISAEQRSNSRAFSTYETGIKNLSSALGATNTGPVAGWLPAVTPNAQVAEGAAAVMAPILKSLFREAGEGTFTEGDQKLLMDMLPSRNDHPDAAKAKLKFIDDLVREKLGQAPAQTDEPPTAGGVRFLGFE